MRISSFLLLCLCAVFSAGLWIGCGSDAEDDPTTLPMETEGTLDIADVELETRADSVAMQMYQAHGGRAWATVPYLRFNFGVAQGDSARVVARHLWNYQTGNYRLEWDKGADSTYVALFDVSGSVDATPPGTVYLNGQAVANTESGELLEEAQRRFINDSYWLLAPLKVFDNGVQREYVADSSTSEYDVITLTFEDVGMTPGDQYWFYVDKETGLLQRWAFHLEGMEEAEPPRVFDWTDPVTLESSEGSLRLFTRKEAVGAPVAIVTDNVEVIGSLEQSIFTAAQPVLENNPLTE